MVLGLFSRKKEAASAGVRRGSRSRPSLPQFRPPYSEQFQPAPLESFDGDDALKSLQQGRFAKVLRDQAALEGKRDAQKIVEKAKKELEQRTALVPAGTITLPQTLTAQPGGAEEEIEVQPYLLDVCTVTNAQFQRFVDAGGYDELEFWPEEIWPHLIELKDLSGQPGPRFWRQGRHDVRLAKHPVVGVSWYEAQAYALWVGQRLPSEAEWQMAASWHINSSTNLMRRFPWGDAMDKNKCNIWGSRVGMTAPVDEYTPGAAPNHVLQLIGNVWEWTDTEFNITDAQGKLIVGEMPMHVIRGAAFDTYFESQATSQFRTGQIALARSHNTGFRCAMNLSDAAWINDG